MSGFSEITSAMYHDAQATIATQAAQIEALTKAANAVLALPYAQHEMRYLDKGIGTKTENSAWLELRNAVSNTGKK